MQGLSSPQWTTASWRLSPYSAAIKSLYCGGVIRRSAAKLGPFLYCCKHSFKDWVCMSQTSLLHCSCSSSGLWLPQSTFNPKKKSQKKFCLLLRFSTCLLLRFSTVCHPKIASVKDLRAHPKIALSKMKFVRGIYSGFSTINSRADMY